MGDTHKRRDQNRGFCCCCAPLAIFTAALAMYVASDWPHVRMFANKLVNDLGGGGFCFPAAAAGLALVYVVMRTLVRHPRGDRGPAGGPPEGGIRQPMPERVPVYVEATRPPASKFWQHKTVERQAEFTPTNDGYTPAPGVDPERTYWPAVSKSHGVSSTARGQGEQGRQQNTQHEPAHVPVKGQGQK